VKKLGKFHPSEPYYLVGVVPKKLNGVLSSVTEIRILFPIP